MGLEVVEFILAVEKALDLTIPDRDAETIGTPRQLVGYLEMRLAEGPRAGRWSRADLEHLVIGLLVQVLEHDRFGLDTPFRDILP